MLANGLRHLIALLIILGVLSAATNAILRSVFHAGAPWAQEIPMVLCGIVTLMACIIAYHATIDKHIRVEIATKNISKQSRNLLEIIGIITCLLPWMGVLLWGAIGHPMAFVRFAWLTQETSENVGGMAMVYLYKSLLAVFAGAFILQAIWRLLHHIRELRR